MKVKQFRNLLSNLDEELEVQFRDCHENDINVESLSLEFDCCDENGHEHYKVVIS